MCAILDPSASGVIAGDPPPDIGGILRAYLTGTSPPGLLAMTSPSERAYVQWLAARYYTGRGRLVEMGCWLGSLTRSLALGLRDNPAPDSASFRIQVFDRFLWTVIMEDWVRNTPVQGRFKPGDDYTALYLERMADFAGRIEITKADLTTAAWSGGAIEIVLVDVMKTVPLTRNISNTFFPALIPGRGLIVHQDYFTFGHPWIHIATFMMAGALSVYHVVPDSCTAAFRVERPIAPLADFPGDPNGFTDAQISEAYAWNRRMLPAGVQATLASAEVHLRMQRREWDVAERLYWTYTRGSFEGAPAFADMYRFNRRFGGIPFRDPRMDDVR
jgi:hypothetical protein